MAINNDKRILIGKDTICEFLEIGESAFYTLIKEGLPVTLIGGRWFGHKDNIEEYFRQRTLIRVKEIPLDAERPGMCLNFLTFLWSA